jgi:hypothetical protein
MSPGRRERAVAADRVAETAGDKANRQGQKKWLTVGRPAIFAYDLLIVAVLISLGALYVKSPSLFSFGDDPYKLAIESMWFGSLGGVIISLKGVYDHSEGSDGWDHSYNLWHLGRPVSGAVAGLMTVVLLMVVNSNDLSRPVVFAAAFIFGTQERRFFNFLYEVARLVVQVPEEQKTGLRITDVQPAEGPSGAVIVIIGQGIDPNATVKLGSIAVEKLVVSNDATTAAGVIPNRPLGTDEVELVVTNPNGTSVSFPRKFKFTA